jgi:hypothetical protein
MLGDLRGEFLRVIVREEEFRTLEYPGKSSASRGPNAAGPREALRADPLPSPLKAQSQAYTALAAAVRYNNPRGQFYRGEFGDISVLA